MLNLKQLQQLTKFAYQTRHIATPENMLLAATFISWNVKAGHAW